MTDEAFNAADPAAVKARQMTAKQRREQAEADWRWMVADARGCRILAALVAESGALRPAVFADPHSLATHAGRQSVGLRIIAAVRAADPAALAKIITEDA